MTGHAARSVPLRRAMARAISNLNRDQQTHAVRAAKRVLGEALDADRAEHGDAPDRPDRIHPQRSFSP